MKSNWYNGLLQIRRKEGQERVSDTLKKLLVLQCFTYRKGITSRSRTKRGSTRLTGKSDNEMSIKLIVNSQTFYKSANLPYFCTRNTKCL